MTLSQSATAPDDFLHALQLGLARPQKSISPKYFYDGPGSALFDRICALPEYYPTRTECALLEQHVGEIAQHIGAQAEVLEFGAGSLAKMRLLMQGLNQPTRFIPIDISGEHLAQSAQLLAVDFPMLEVLPLVADYTNELALPPVHVRSRRRVGFFPGSTIGNLAPSEALAFLSRTAKYLRAGGLLLGADLVKHPDQLHAAYNDSQGVTAQFNLNVLARANRELGADFVLDHFAHSAFYNAPLRRIEMHLLSTCDQVVHIGGQTYGFADGETLHTENSYKFTLNGLRELARQAGFTPVTTWTDPEHLFCLIWLEA